jgi:hypothetical protein
MATTESRSARTARLLVTQETASASASERAGRQEEKHQNCLEHLVVLKNREDDHYLFSSYNSNTRTRGASASPKRARARPVPYAGKPSTGDDDGHGNNGHGDDGMIPAAWRFDLVHWIRRCATHFDVPCAVEPLAISYMDRFLATLTPKERTLENGVLLVALTALHLAMSLCMGPSLCVSFEALLEEIDSVPCGVNATTVEQLHHFMLGAFQYHVHPPLACDYLHLHCQLLTTSHDVNHGHGHGRVTVRSSSSTGAEYLEEQGNLLANEAMRSAEFVRFAWHTVSLCALGVMMEYEYTCTLFKTKPTNAYRAFLLRMGEELHIDMGSYMRGAQWKDVHERTESLSLLSNHGPINHTHARLSPRLVQQVATATAHTNTSASDGDNDNDDIRIIRAMLWKILLDQQQAVAVAVEDEECTAGTMPTSFRNNKEAKATFITTRTTAALYHPDIDDQMVDMFLLSKSNSATAQYSNSNDDITTSSGLLHPIPIPIVPCGSPVSVMGFDYSDGVNSNTNTIIGEEQDESPNKLEFDFSKSTSENYACAVVWEDHVLQWKARMRMVGGRGKDQQSQPMFDESLMIPDFDMDTDMDACTTDDDCKNKQSQTSTRLLPSAATATSALDMHVP